MTSLHDILCDLRNDELAYRVKLLKVKPKGTRKAELIKAIETAFAGKGLEAIWNSLDRLEQAAVAEACYAPGFAYDEPRIRAKYGDVPLFYKLSKNGRSDQRYRRKSKNTATRLNLLLYTHHGLTKERIVPTDVATRLRDFVPEPSELNVSTLEAPVAEEGLFVRETEHESLADVMALLRLVEQGDLRISAKTGKVSTAVCRKILECLGNGDFFPPEVAYKLGKQSYEQEIGAIKPIAWARLLEVGRYFTQNGSRSKLTPAGVKALSLAPHQIIRHLWDKWLANVKYDEFNRIDNIKGQQSKGHMTAKSPRRFVIDDALSECPANQWIGLEQFSVYMQGAGHTFEVSRNLWKLYVGQAQHGSFGYAGCGDWNTVQFRYMLCVLFEYVATLGLIDIAYVHPRVGAKDYRGEWGTDGLAWLSRYDGLRAFRITNLGAYCLGMTPDYKPSQLQSSLTLRVLPSLRIEVLSGTLSPVEELQLETWAEPVASTVWQLETSRALEAVERGQSVEDFTEFLQRCDDQPLPETVIGFLETSASNGQAVRNRGEAYLFDCRDAATAAIISAQSELKGYCFRCGETSLAVPESHVVKFRKIVRSLELGIV
ncbi:MAG: hypothetical protein ACSHYA_14405 [Opitutaceae bacterium]